MPALLRRLAAAATLLLAFLMVVVLALHGSGAVAFGPVPSPTPTPAPTAIVTTRPTPTLAPAQLLARIEAQVRTLRGLPAPSIGPPEIIDRAALEAKLRAGFDRDYPPNRRRADNLLLHALGLLEPGQDYGQLQLKLLAGQVIGLYDDHDKRMTIVTEAGLGPEAQVTYAHEYTHALQDGTFGLARLDTQAPGQDDRDLARVALVEGDATATMVRWAVANLTPEELVGISETPMPDLSGIPSWMVAMLEFPYTAGADFVGRLYAEGGWPAVDAAFREPPASTEQVIHPEKYVAREKPDAVAAPGLARALGSGWGEVPADTLGEEGIVLWLEAFGLDELTAAEAATGWGGDRAVAASGPGSAIAVAWRIAWDAPADATQFAQAYRQRSAGLKLAHRLVQLSPTEVLVVQASTSALVDRAVAGLR